MRKLNNVRAVFDEAKNVGKQSGNLDSTSGPTWKIIYNAFALTPYQRVSNLQLYPSQWCNATLYGELQCDVDACY